MNTQQAHFKSMCYYNYLSIASCAVGWMWYNNNCYKLSDTQVTQVAATADCQQARGTLLTLESASKNTHFHTLVG